MRLRRPPAAVALLAGLWLLATGPAAGAHGVLRASDPPVGASLAAPPHAVTLSFSEAPDLGLSSVHVLDTAGRALERGRPEPVPGRSLALRVPLGGLPAGTYTVSWKVVSRVDGHTTGGAYVFGVGVPPVAPPGARQVMTTRADAPSPAAVAGRWGFYWGLALLVGAAASGLAVFDRRLPGRPALLLTGAVVVAAGGLAAMVAGARSGAGVPLGTLLGSRVGHLLAWQAGALATAALAVVALLRRPGRAWPLAAVGVTAAGGLLAHALAGHAAAPSSLRGVNLATQWAHLLAVGAWVGGLPWLLAGLRGRDRAGQVAAAVRFSRLATACLAAVAVTGFVRAAEELGGWARLLDTAFGRVLDVKLALFGALVLVGALNHWLVVPALAAGSGPVARLRRRVGAEIWLAAGVLLATALLSQLAPGTAARAARPVAAVAAPRLASGTDYATSVRATLVVSPGNAGPNSFTVSVADYDTGRPVPVDGVRLTCSLPGKPDLQASSLELARAPDGRWHGQGSVLSVAGRWEVTALVETHAGALAVPLEVDAGLPAAGFRRS